MTRAIEEDGAKRYYRHGEAFWKELIIRQAQSCQGVRKFCQANGVATGTFHKWRARLGRRTEVAAQGPVATPDAMFIAIAQEREGTATLPPELSNSPSPRSATRDSILVTSGGMRMELTGAYAERIVRHLLGRMNGFAC